MKLGLLACGALSALVSIAQAAPPDPENASGPMRLTGPQMDIATAGGVTNIWIASAAAADELNARFGQRQLNGNIQLVISINGLPENGSFKSSKEIVVPSGGGTATVGETIFEGQWP